MVLPPLKGYYRRGKGIVIIVNVRLFRNPIPCLLRDCEGTQETNLGTGKGTWETIAVFEDMLSSLLSRVLIDPLCLFVERSNNRVRKPSLLN